MRPVLAAMIAVVLLGLPDDAAAGQNSVSVGELTCEYLENPLGIDVVKPRLSWVLGPGPRGQCRATIESWWPAAQRTFRMTGETSGIREKSTPTSPPSWSTRAGR